MYKETLNNSTLFSLFVVFGSLAAVSLSLQVAYSKVIKMGRLTKQSRGDVLQPNLKSFFASGISMFLYSVFMTIRVVKTVIDMNESG